MVTRRKTTTKRRPSTGGSAAKTAPRRRRNSTGINKIPALGAGAAFVMSALPEIKYTAETLADGLGKVFKGQGTGDIGNIPGFWVRHAEQKGKNWILSTGAGYAAGYAVKEFIPNRGILGKAKRAIGGLAKKVF